MNSPPTPPYCGSVAAALHLMNSQIRCGSCREKGLFIALRWMQPDRGMMWQAENPELAREFPAGTASKARQSRLHQAQGVFPVFLCCIPSKWTIIFDDLSHFAIFLSLLEHETPCKCPFGHLLSHIKQQTIGSNFY